MKINVSIDMKEQIVEVQLDDGAVQKTKFPVHRHKVPQAAPQDEGGEDLPLIGKSPVGSPGYVACKKRRSLRAMLGYTTQQAATAAKVGHSSVQRWEKSQPSKKTGILRRYDTWLIQRAIEKGVI